MVCSPAHGCAEPACASIRVLEKGGDFGGTWYWNRYPGAMCDVESYIYLPLLEEIGYIPKEKYSHAPEILAHSRAIAERYDLYDNACLQTEVTELRWDDGARRWIISTNHGDAMRARFVCMANGPLHRPKLPAIDGIETYAGHSFHTSRWDYAYSGGDCDGGLTGLEGKASPSSVRGRRPFSACPTSVGLQRSSTSSSALRHRSTSATTVTRRRHGRRACGPAGRSSAWTTSTRWCPVGSRPRIW